MKTTLVVLVCVAYVFVCDAQITDPVPKGFDWCDPNLCLSGKPEHIACKNDGKFKSNCVNARFLPIPPSCRQAILDAHNEYRARVASGKVASTWPKAARMPPVEYDTMLASVASLNCLNCKFAHDKCRNTDTYSLSGQNLGIEYSTASRDNIDCVTFVKNRIKSWYNEVNYLPPDVITAYRSSVDENSEGYGHATTLLTDRAYKVGCAICQFDSVRQGRTVNSTELACNYASTNVNGFNVWKHGDTAKECKKGKDTKFAGLCSLSENKEYDPHYISEGKEGNEMRWPDDFLSDHSDYEYED